jgi:hypothetical protein
MNQGKLMKTNQILPKTRGTYLLVGIVLVLLGGLVTAARTSRTSPSNKVVADSALTHASPARSRPIADFESELITITPHGFEPQSITRPHGRFLLMIDNRSGLAAPALTLTREPSERVRELQVPRETPNWSDVVNLPPGQYVLSEPSHPGWSCLITITSQ